MSVRDRIDGWKYRVAAALLGPRWYVPASVKDEAWIVIQSPTLVSWFPVATLDLKMELEVPALDGERYPNPKGPLQRTGRFSGTIGIDEEAA